MRSLVLGMFLSAFCPMFAQYTTAVKIKDFFAAMPDSILPLMTRNDRLDCIDYIENHMRARTHNKLDDEVELETMTDDYLLLRTSGSTYQEMKLFLMNDTTPLFCIISTVQQGDSLLRTYDSELRFYNQYFQELPTAKYLTTPSLDSFLTEIPDSARNGVEQAMLSLNVYHPMHIQFAKTPFTILFMPQINMLTTEEKKTLAPYLRVQEAQLQK